MSNNLCQSIVIKRFIICNRDNGNLCVEDLPDQIPTTLQSTMMSHSQPSEQSTIPSNKKQLPEVHSLMENATEIPEEVIFNFGVLQFY